MWISLTVINKQDYAQDSPQHEETAVFTHEPAGTPLAEKFNSDDGPDAEKQIYRREKTDCSLLFCISGTSNQEQDHQEDGAEQLLHSNESPAKIAAAHILQKDLAGAKAEGRMFKTKTRPFLPIAQ